MQFLLLGLVLLVFILLFGRAFARADTRTLAKNIRRVGGWGALALALVFAVTGRLVFALPLAAFGFSLLGGVFPWQSALGSGAKTQGQRSTVRTDMLEMTLEHDTGQMDGLVRKGRFAGHRLSNLSETELNIVLEEARARDSQAAQLLEAFIARIQQGANQGERTDSSRASASTHGMTLDEAYAVLGLKPGANREDIHQAHRALMKKYHPDQGGTTYLASKINEAKDVLIRHVR